jgi:hypothetical protein
MVKKYHSDLKKICILNYKAGDVVWNWISGNKKSTIIESCCCRYENITIDETSHTRQDYQWYH